MKEFITTKPALQEMLKGILYRKERSKAGVRKVGSTLYINQSRDTQKDVKFGSIYIKHGRERSKPWVDT